MWRQPVQVQYFDIFTNCKLHELKVYRYHIGIIFKILKNIKN